MTKDKLVKRITAILLTTLMLTSVPGYVSADELEQEQNDIITENISDDNVAVPGNESLPDEIPTDEIHPERNVITEGNPNDQSNPTNGITETEMEAIRVCAAGEDGKITVVWSAVEGAEYYLVITDGELSAMVDASRATSLKTVVTADAESRHNIIVEAYQKGADTVFLEEEGVSEEESDDEPNDILIGKGDIEDVGAASRSKITISRTEGTSLGINLKTMLGEPHNGYSVVQGGCTDGIYAYYLMVSSHDQKGKILKTVAGKGTVVASSGVINTCHGNGMTINTKSRKLVVVGREERRNQLAVINADNLKSVSYYNVDYSNTGYWNKSADKGLAAIAYIPKYDCYAALQRSTHEILILDSEFKVIGEAGTKIKSNYPGTYQAMDADERYVYLVLSAYSSEQPYNLILALDWNSENLLEIANNNRDYISDRWFCNNDGSGRPDTVIRVNTPYEAENIYHIDQGNGTSRFYLSEYYSNPKYHWVTRTKSYKVKWKKVKKKVKVKKIKKNGKWKWKYKWKKVWKYKTKYKKVKEYEFHYYNRDNYVYDLGVF